MRFPSESPSSELLPEPIVTIPSTTERWQIENLEIKEWIPFAMVVTDERPFYPPTARVKLAYEVIYSSDFSPTVKYEMVFETIIVWGLDNYWYGYIPLSLSNNFPNNINVPSGVSSIQVVWRAKALYAGSMYLAEEQGPTIGPFLPQLDRINIKLAQYGLVLTTLLFGLGAAFELFKSYMWRA